MGILDLFRKPKATSPATSAVKSELPSVSYALAYFVLPRGFFDNCEKFAAMWMDPVMPGGAVLYHMGCQFHGAEPNRENEASFRVSHGELDDATDFYLLQYPAPPVLDFLKMFPGKNLAEAEVPVPGPYFSAVLRNRQTKAIAYYVLGQAPVGGGTTLRSVTQEGANLNLGPGPEPRVEKFLECLREKVRAAA